MLSGRSLALVVVLGLWSTVFAYGQRERIITPPQQVQPQPQTSDNGQYGRRFFVQLRGIFGRFRDSDLQRAFEMAKPIQCSDLINEKGEWRTVAFFNEKRELGDWYRANFEEVKSDLSVFQFKGVCRGDRGPVQLTTKFPVTESMEAFENGKIGLDEVDVNVNAPVGAFFDSRSGAYSFDLPYLFLVSQQDNESLYSLDPPHLLDRDKYATEVRDHWDCKSVAADAVTYQFLICRTTTLPRSMTGRNQNVAPAFGASAYFILSDGKEASSSVKLSFDDSSNTKRPVEDLSVPTPEEEPALAAWGSPDADERIVDLFRDEFRIRFAVSAWAGRLNSAQVLSGGRLASLATATPTSGADYCIWLPDAKVSPDDATLYSINVHDQDAKSASSITVDLKTAKGEHFGSLQCTFPRATSATSITYSRWSSMVGEYLALEIRP
jgi:hypothetical protein